MAFYAAFSSSTLGRLSAMHELLGDAPRGIKKLAEVLGSQGNFRAYREKIKKITTDYIPYFGSASSSRSYRPTMQLTYLRNRPQGHAHHPR